MSYARSVQGPATSVTAITALSKIGRPEPGDGREYVEPFGLTSDDVPALIELAKRWLDDAHFEKTSETSAMWGPVHAWRALAELGEQIVVPMFLEMLDELDRRGDDWFLEEFPPLCERFGASEMELLVTYLLDAQHTEYARVAAAHGLREVTLGDPSTRDRVCEALASALRPMSGEHPDLNAFLVSYLTDLRSVEHAGIIERAFKAGVVNEDVCGVWSQISVELGVGRRPQRPAAHTSRAKTDKAARKRQRSARKKNRRR